MADNDGLVASGMLERQAIVETKLTVLAKSMDDFKVEMKESLRTLQLSISSVGKDNFDRVVKIIEDKEKVQAERDATKAIVDADRESENKKSRERVTYMWIALGVVVTMLLSWGKIIEFMKAALK